MRWEAAAVTLVILLSTAQVGAWPTPPPGPYVPHGPIDIENDAAFNASNGVVSGAGTPADPFVISGWSISSGHTMGIVITNVTSSFVVRNNLVEADYPIWIHDMASVGVVDNNRIVANSAGITVASADAVIVNNSFVGNLGTGGINGIVLTKSNSDVEQNEFIYMPYAILATEGSPTIRCNDIHDDTVLAGVSVKFTTNATIECNTISSCVTGIVSLDAIGTVIVNNTVTECQFGLDVTLTKDATILNNTIRASFHTQVHFWHTSGNFSGNLVVDGMADGIVSEQSPMVVSNNTIEANLHVGLWLINTAAEVDANLVAHNSVGIFFDGVSASDLTANVIVNNTVGIDLPYASRQAILHMSANLVNGVNVDGTLNASQQVFFDQAANVQIDGGLRDSGFSAGYFGSISAQGNLVLYDVDSVFVGASVISHTNVGVTAVNSFNVVVNGSVITDAIVGVSASAVFTGMQEPACAVSVKNSTINITIDPTGTLGVDVHDCFVHLSNDTIATVATGVRVDAQTTGIIQGTVITNTDVGLDVSAQSGLTVSGNVVENGGVGARFSGGQLTVTGNVFTQLDVGVSLTGGATLTFLRNDVTLDGTGVADGGACDGRSDTACGTLLAQGNVFAGNGGDGVRVNGTSTFQGDVFVGNGGNGAVLASAALLNVTADQNGGDGLVINGSWSIRASQFVGNAHDGALVAGTGEVRGSVFNSNQDAGLHTRASYVEVLDSNFSRNFDGILFDDAVSTGGGPTVSTTAILRSLPDGGSFDPMDVHRSVLLGNERDAIRAGLQLVNATRNYWGGGPPAIDVADTVGAFQNGVTPLVIFTPWYVDPALTTTGPLPGL
jgi:parallel beta-helix repeat protein